MSSDIFYCLAASCPTVVMYTVSKYYRYVAIAWVAPLPLPLIALTLTNTDTDDIGYDLTRWWLVSGRSILFFFAGPVLTIVTISLTMFIGSVWCLGSLMANTTNAVRKEDNMRRLVQCTKLASGMGLSWLFGSISNFWDFDSFWYVFALARNAIQGVHIFLAFGIPGRIRRLRRDVTEANCTVTDQSTKQKLTFWVQDNIDKRLQVSYPNAFSWKKTFAFWCGHWWVCFNSQLSDINCYSNKVFVVC